MNGLRSRLNSWHRQSSQLHDSRESTSRELAIFEERQRALQDSRQLVVNEQSRLTDELRIAIERLAEAESESVRAQAEFEEAQAQGKAARESLAARQDQRAGLEADLLAAQNKLTEYTARSAQLHAHQNELAARVDTQKRKLEAAAQAVVAADAVLEKGEKESQRAASAQKLAGTALGEAEAGLRAAQERLSGLEERIKKQQDTRESKQPNWPV